MNFHRLFGSFFIFTKMYAIAPKLDANSETPDPNQWIFTDFLGVFQIHKNVRRAPKLDENSETPDPNQWIFTDFLGVFSDSQKCTQ